MRSRHGVRGLLVLGVLLMVVALSACDWTGYLGGNGRTGWNAGENSLTPAAAATLHQAWKVSDSGKPESGIFSQPIVASDVVYWGSYDGYERATDTSGHLKWKTFLGHTDATAEGCVDPSTLGVVSTGTLTTDVKVGSAQSVLYVGGGDSNMYALNALTGAVLWKHSVGSNPDHFLYSSPAVSGNSVYIGVASFGDCPLVQGQILQLNRVTGAVQHFINLVPNGCVGAGVWGSPTLDAAAGTIYFTTGTPDPCSASGLDVAPSVVEVSMSNLSFIGAWTIPLAQQDEDPDFGSTPTLFTGTINGTTQDLVGAINKNGLFYAFKRGALGAGPVWETRIAVGGGNPLTGSGDAASAAWDGKTLYIGGDTVTINSQDCQGSLNAVNPSTGKFIWRHCYTDGFVLGGVTGGSGGIVSVGEGNNISVLNAANGNTAKTFTGAGTFLGPPTIANGMVFDGDQSGNLYALTTS